MALKNNTWTLNNWYDQDVAGNVSYSGASELWAWGSNSYGGLGLNTTTPQYSSPVQISSNSTWNFIPSGSSHTASQTLLTKTDGTLWSWGYNNVGQLGQNNTTHISSPVQVPGTTWSSVVAGRYNSFAIKTDGTLWTWGHNNRGVFGIPSYAHNAKVSSPVQVPGTTWDKIYSSNTMAFAIKTDGTLWSWGDNTLGSLGLNQGNTDDKSSPTQIPGNNWARVASGTENATLATKTDGTLWGWGDNYFGGLGQNSQTSYSSPIQIGSDATWDYTADYKIVMGQPGMGLAIKTDGTLWSWGYNSNGTTAGINPGTQYRSSPTQIPGTTWRTISASYGRSILATKTDNTFWNWGRGGGAAANVGGAYFGDATGDTKRSSPVQVPGEWKNAISRRRDAFLEKLL